MERNELAQAIYRASHLTGQFRLRSGATASEYFDKYLFESDPALLGAIVEHLAPLMPADIDALAGLELGGVPIHDQKVVVIKEITVANKTEHTIRIFHGSNAYKHVTV